MTETDVKLSELRKGIHHLTHVNQDGWVLNWGDAPETRFELVCRKASAEQVENIDKLLSKAYQEALQKLT
jgi:hypothetical protein